MSLIGGMIGTSARGARVIGASGLSASLEFTPASGTEFVMCHGLGTTTFLAEIWMTHTNPHHLVYPEDVMPSGQNHVIVQLDTPMYGILNLIGLKF